MSARRSSVRGVEALLFGRDRELEHLRVFIDEAGVDGGALLLTGDAGVGKSVLLDVAARRAEAVGTRVVRAVGAEFEAEVSFSGLSYVLHPLLDGLAALPIPENLGKIARDIAAAAGMAVDPDVCILNYYDDEGRMGLHQDKDEGPRSLAEGWPVVSVSIGDTARFLFGGLRRRDPIEPILLQSGDAFVFGGAARLRFHGVSRIVPHTAPEALGMSGRFNLTFRQSDGAP